MSRFDVFEMFDDGEVLWCQATADLDGARKLAEEKAARTKNSFLILDQATQRKFFVNGRTREAKSPRGNEKGASGPGAPA